MEASTAEWDPLAPSNSMIWKKSAKFKASSADGCADIDGKSLSKNTSNHLTQRACARGTGKLTGSIRLQEVYFQRRNLIFGFWFDFVDNSLVFRMLEDEEENVQQLEILVARFYRPFKMAASSKKYEKTIHMFYVWFKISFWHLFFFFSMFKFVVGDVHVTMKATVFAWRYQLHLSQLWNDPVSPPDLLQRPTSSHE